MQRLLAIGRCFFGISLMGIGLQHFLHASFPPFLVPDATGLPGVSFWAMAAGALFILAGLTLCCNIKTRTVSPGLGVLLLLFFLLLHLPYQLRHHPEMLGVWTNPLKCLAFSGGAFIIASSGKAGNERLLPSLPTNKLFVTGLFFFCVMLVVFGLMHFVYADFVATVVPSLVPAPLFWTYFAGVALVGSGLALLLKVKPAAVALLLGAMLFLWVIVLHIPRAVAAPAADNGNELTSVFQALGFSGIALVLSALLRKPVAAKAASKEAGVPAWESV